MIARRLGHLHHQLRNLDAIEFRLAVGSLAARHDRRGSYRSLEKEIDAAIMVPSNVAELQVFIPDQVP